MKANSLDMVSWLLFPRPVDPDNVWARRLLRRGAGGETKTGRREPAFRATAIAIWIGTIAATFGAPAVLALAHAPFSGYRRRRRLMNDPALLELLRLPGDRAEAAHALRAAVERWSRRMALLAAAAWLVGAVWLGAMWKITVDAGTSSDRELRWIATISLVGAIWWAAACAGWWAGCHMRASVIASWPRLWLAKAIGLALAAWLKLGIAYGGALIALLWFAFARGTTDAMVNAAAVAMMAGLAAMEAALGWQRLRWAEAAWRGAAASLQAELADVAAVLERKEAGE